MRRISEMYRLSSGTDYTHLCKECSNCIAVKAGHVCRLYQEAGGDAPWNTHSIACKYYNLPHLPEKKKETTSEGVQMDIFDFPEALP